VIHVSLLIFGSMPGILRNGITKNKEKVRGNAYASLTLNFIRWLGWMPFFERLLFSFPSTPRGKASTCTLPAGRWKRGNFVSRIKNALALQGPPPQKFLDFQALFAYPFTEFNRIFS